MKVTKHIEQLLMQGRKPAELVELGFPKSVVTRVRRQLKEEKAAQRTNIPGSARRARNDYAPPPLSATDTKPDKQEVEYSGNNLQKLDRPVDATHQVSALLDAAYENGTRKREQCAYQEDGVCVRQTWTSRAEVTQGIGEPVFLAIDEEEHRWYVKPSVFYCAMCTRFLEDSMNDVESNSFADPLSGAKDKITCYSCGSKGFIAAHIKCTKCGRQMYWGWFPKE